MRVTGPGDFFFKPFFDTLAKHDTLDGFDMDKDYTKDYPQEDVLRGLEETVQVLEEEFHEKGVILLLSFQPIKIHFHRRKYSAIPSEMSMYQQVTAGVQSPWLGL
jgi:hypothetical protein